jgi:Tfp pilus assembly PilM family ATPase
MSRPAFFGESRVPGAAVEFAAHRISGAVVELRGARPVVAAHAAEPLPEGALVPALGAQNLVDRGVVAAALGRVLDGLGRPRRIGIIVPDSIAKVSIARFEHVPSRAADLDQLVRWQVRKSAPFPIEAAQVSYTRGLRTAEGQEFIVTVARRDIVEEYESLCAGAGAHAGIVDLTTFNVVNAVLAAPGAPSTGSDWLLVNVAPDYASICILRDRDLVFFRNRGAEGGDASLADLVHQTAMYYEDRLQGAGLGRVFLGGASGGGVSPADVDHARRSIEARLGKAVEIVDPSAAAGLTDRIAAAPALLDTLAPLVGLLLRDREAA